MKKSLTLSRVATFIIIVVMALASATATQTLAQGPQPQAATPLGRKFTYQGQLKNSTNGTPINGPCSFQFSLWDEVGSGTPPTGGTQKGSTQTVNASVVNGLFTVEIDFGNQFTGEARWLQTAVKCGNDTSPTTMDKRTALNASPYALGLRPGASIQNVPGQSVATIAGDNVGVFGYSTSGASNNGIGVRGSHSDSGWGVYGDSPSGVGVYGSTAFGTGVYGKANVGTGVHGVSTSTAASCCPAAILGESTSAAEGIGVWGKALATTGANYGVAGETASPQGKAVQGYATNGGIGVYGFSVNGYAGRFDGRVRTNVLEIAGGSDLAERFEVKSEASIEPGTLMVIDEHTPGKLKMSDGAYDSKVAGIVSGAGGVNPGMTLAQDGVMDGDISIAIAGRVYVKAEALSAPIKPGDLLTTSSIPGHAMKASDRERSHGAIIGKALMGLDSGTGLVLVLVNLQ